MAGDGLAEAAPSPSLAHVDAPQAPGAWIGQERGRVEAADRDRRAAVEHAAERLPDLSDRLAPLLRRAGDEAVALGGGV
ncbi:MAG: hypothetical protein ICV73_17315 [Acetobacteraceae bacterium]|nr:hypothetical protein [Acetobacteraceae bacterium]